MGLPATSRHSRETAPEGATHTARSGCFADRGAAIQGHLDQEARLEEENPMATTPLLPSKKILTRSTAAGIFRRLSRKGKMAVIVFFFLVGAASVAALTLATSTADNNLATSNTITATDSIQVAVVDNPGGDCSTATFSVASPNPAVDNDTLDLNLPGFGFVGAAKVVCVGNLGSTAGQLLVRIDNFSSVETGPCSANESAAGDTDCAASDPGELIDLARLIITASDIVGCIPEWTLSTFNFVDESPEYLTAVVDLNFQPGDGCAFTFGVVEADTLPSSPSIPVYGIGETDTVQFDIEFVLTDDGTV